MSNPHQQLQDSDAPGSDPQADIGRFVSNLAYAVNQGIALVVAPYGLLPLDMHLLLICREMEECTATQLARMLPVDAARISRIVNTLVENGYLRRRRRRDDRRVVTLRLTPEGEALVDEAAQSLRDYYASLTEGMSEQEVRVFTNAAMRIIANYEEIIGS